MWDALFGKSRPRPESVVAADDAQEAADRAPALVDAANGSGWYDEHGNQVDVAVVALCLLRRAASGDQSRMEAGDDAVRDALKEAQPDAVVWLASRVISYMDEHAFPEAVEPWLRDRS